MKHLALFTLWFGYGLLHSLLATSRFKTLMLRYFSKKNHYRIWYNVIATLLLIGLLTIQFSVKSNALWTNSYVEQFVGILSVIVGVYLMRSAFRSYSTSEFLGLTATADEFSAFCQDGLLAYVRHPLYSATLLIIWGAFLFSNTSSMLTMCMALTLYLIIGIYWEEKKLIAAYGDVYKEYRQRVPMLIPPII